MSLLIFKFTIFCSSIPISLVVEVQGTQYLSEPPIWLLKVASGLCPVWGFFQSFPCAHKHHDSNNIQMYFFVGSIGDFAVDIVVMVSYCHKVPSVVSNLQIYHISSSWINCWFWCQSWVNSAVSGQNFQCFQKMILRFRDCI